MIDPVVFRRLRLEAGLSENEVARRSGLAPTVVELIEAGDAKGRTTLAAAARLATAIGVRLSEVLEEDGEVEATDLAEGNDEDATLIESLLFTAGKRIHFDTLVAVTGWDVGRVRRAVDAVEERLRCRGIRLVRYGNTCGLRPHVQTRTKKQLAQLERLIMCKDGLTIVEATVLYMIWEGENRPTRRVLLKNSYRRLIVERLVNAGLIRARPNRRPTRLEPLGSVGRLSLSDEMLLALAPVWQRP